MAARFVGGIASLGLHVALALWIMLPAPKIVPPPSHTMWSYKAEKDIPKLRGTGFDSGEALACAVTSYSGIGLVHNPQGRIIDVGTGTPAGNAGLKEGDVILNPEVFDTNHYPPGTVLQLRLMRDGREIVLPVSPGRICQD